MYFIFKILEVEIFKEMYVFFNKESVCYYFE